jgi:hypothetical protein
VFSSSVSDIYMLDPEDEDSSPWDVSNCQLAQHYITKGLHL